MVRTAQRATGLEGQAHKEIRGQSSRQTNTGKGPAGDIDGEHHSRVPVNMSHYLLPSTSVLDKSKDEWDFIIDPDVRQSLYCWLEY